MHRFIHKYKLYTLLFTAIFLLAFRGNVTAVTITDDDGFKVTFDKPFSRIISLYPAHTENLFYLGAESQLIGVGKNDNYPASISELDRYSYHDNTEKFLAAAPDLILIRPMISRSQPELMKKLRTSGITIVSLQPTSIDQMFDYWRKLGLLTGKEDESETMVEQFKRSESEIRSTLPGDPGSRPRVYFESIHSKMKTFAPSAIAIFALEAAGGWNIAQDAVGRNNSNIAPYGKERLLSHAGDIDIFLSQVGRMNRVEVQDINNEPGFSLIKAVQEGAVHLIEEELVSRPTMRLLIGIRKIQRLLHPSVNSQQR